MSTSQSKNRPVVDFNSLTAIDDPDHIRIENILERLIELKVAADESKTEAEKLKLELRSFYALYSLRGIRWEDWLIIEKSGSQRTSIDPKILAEQGVPLDIISAATVTSERGDDYIEIRQDKSRKE